MSPQRSSQARSGMRGRVVIGSRQRTGARAYPDATDRSAPARGAGRPVYSTAPRAFSHATRVPARPPSPPKAWSRSTRPARARSAHSTASTSTSTRAPSSACSARTAPARPRPSASSPRSSGPTPAARPSPGFDVRTQADEIRRVIGLSGQYAAVDENLTGRENLWLFGRLYHLSSPRGPQARRRAARAVRADGRRRPGRQDLLGRHAASPRPRRRAHRPPAAADPRRADDRPRPAQPDRDVGRHPRTSSARARRSC